MGRHWRINASIGPCSSCVQNDLTSAWMPIISGTVECLALPCLEKSNLPLAVALDSFFCAWPSSPWFFTIDKGSNSGGELLHNALVGNIATPVITQ